MDLYKSLQAAMGHIDPRQQEGVRQAYLYAKKAHEGQWRASGEPYITHPVAVATILAKMHMDPQSIEAALLHDVIEDADVTKAMLVHEFGQDVADIVDGITKLSRIAVKDRVQVQAENFRKMILAMSKDIRVIIVKLADRLHNMRTIGALSREKQRRITRETLDIYTPIAKRLGMHQLAVELEDIGFKVRYPMRHRALKRALEQGQTKYNVVLNEIIQTLRNALIKAEAEPLNIQGREKHLYSIYKKMKTKNRSFSEITDVYAIRIIVQEAADCYATLGIVHSMYKPSFSRFKDYIAVPKSNGYQALHTVLFGPSGLPIEVQIRSEAMDIEANAGVSSHWLYKAGDITAKESHIETQQWLKSMLDMQQRTGNSLDFLENVKIDLFPEEVYVFTPRGGIIELPAGSTALDYAYAIHTEIGNRCIGASIDRHHAPMSTVLKNGQLVDITTAENARPEASWLDIVVTGKAKMAIKQALSTARCDSSILVGKKLLDKMLRKEGLNLDTIPEDHWQAASKAHDFESKNSLFEAVGLGLIPVRSVKQSMVLDHIDRVLDEDHDGHDSIFTLDGSEGEMVHYAKCCLPLPGDAIFGVIQAGHGLEIHRSTCKHIQKHLKKSDQCIPMTWSNEIRRPFPSTIAVDIENHAGSLALVAYAVAHAQAEIDDVAILNPHEQITHVHVTLRVLSCDHLEQVLQALRQVKSVHSARRHEASSDTTSIE